MQRTRVTLLSLVSIGLMALVFIDQTRADPYASGPPNGGYEPDDKTHWACWVSGGSIGQTIGGTSLGEVFFEDAPYWGITPEWHDSCRSWTDVVFGSLTDNDPPITLGSYVCDKFKSNGECDSASVRENTVWYWYNSSNWYCETYHNWCHELGHSYGLNHYSGAQQSCMRSGQWNGCGWHGGYWYDDHMDHIDEDIN